jgi:hypothetical protein
MVSAWEAGMLSRPATSAIVTLALLASGFATQAQPQQGTLTLACKGTSSDTPDSKRYPLSMGIVLDLTARTVSGFFASGDFPVKITEVTDTTITFDGVDGDPSVTRSRVSGNIDRVTGDLEARIFLPVGQTFYHLQCRPAQRMF